MSEINKKSFVLYCDNYKPIRNLSIENKAKILDAIFCYNLNESLPDMDCMLSAIFDFFKISFDRDIEKYANVCERNRKNIKKRYATKSTTGKSGIPNLPEATKSTDNENENENENENDISKEKYKKESLSVSDIKKFFDRFYATYPKKRSPKLAEKTFTKVIKEQKIKTTDELNIFTGTLVNAVNAQLAEHNNKNPGADYKYWQEPATWLNAGGWLNDVDLTIPAQPVKQQTPKTAGQRNVEFMDWLRSKKQEQINQQKIGENKNEDKKNNSY